MTDTVLEMQAGRQQSGLGRGERRGDGARAGVSARTERTWRIYRSARTGGNSLEVRVSVFVRVFTHRRVDSGGKCVCARGRARACV